jgi:hypothetical protein
VILLLTTLLAVAYVTRKLSRAACHGSKPIQPAYCGSSHRYARIERLYAGRIVIAAESTQGPSDPEKNGAVMEKTITGPAQLTARAGKL